MRVRCEFWQLSNVGDGVNTVLLKHVVADAEEFVATESSFTLPLAPAREAYAMKVIAVEGDIVAEVRVGAAITNTADQSAWIAEGDYAWFSVEPGSLLFVDEYA